MEDAERMARCAAASTRRGEEGIDLSIYLSIYQYTIIYYDINTRRWKRPLAYFVGAWACMRGE
jgi:hypothetical protein